MFPLASGVSPLGDASVWGGLWHADARLADLPCVARGLMSRMRQFWASATVTVPFLSR